MTLLSSPSSFFFWPNLFSLSRIAAGFLVAWLVLGHHLEAAGWVFAVACWTDWADGYIARRLNQHSALGQLLDPLADKIFLTLTFLALGWSGAIPLWAVCLALTRDGVLFLGGILILLARLPVVMKPIMISKVNTVFQMFLVVIVLAFQQPAPDHFHPSGVLEGCMLFFLWGMVLTTVVSGLAYGWIFGSQCCRVPEQQRPLQEHTHDTQES